MGTKLNPGQFDCYDNALPDEPMFVLLARDGSAPALVRAWAEQRAANLVLGSVPESDRGMIAEAQRCADEMEDWRRAHEGEWRKPRSTALTTPPDVAALIERLRKGGPVLDLLFSGMGRHFSNLSEDDMPRPGAVMADAATALAAQQAEVERLRVAYDAVGSIVATQLNRAVAAESALAALAARDETIRQLRAALLSIIELDQHWMGPESATTRIARAALNSTEPSDGR